MSQVIYTQLNKDYAYWTEKRRIGQLKGGHVAGLLSHVENGRVKQNILIDCGLGTLEAIADFCDDAFWDQPLTIFITHGHIDHHAELMILSEIYGKRRSANLRDLRPPLNVYCTAETQPHLFNTHRYGYTGGKTLAHQLVTPDAPIQCGSFTVTPLAVHHFAGSVFYVITWDHHKIVIGWDMTTLPITEHVLTALRDPSLAFFEATTWTPMAQYSDHVSLVELIENGFLEQVRLEYDPAREKYGAYLVHYSGWEDPWRALTDAQLKEKIDREYPAFASVLRVAERGQRWHFQTFQTSEFSENSEV